ncbi:hypothetical protein CR513_05081, partial [Mucuna pruriens]
MKEKKIGREMLSWRTKLEKLLCLKYLGSKSLAKTVVFQTMKDEPLSFHEITSSMKRRWNGSLRVAASGVAVVFHRQSHGMEEMRFSIVIVLEVSRVMEI